MTASLSFALNHMAAPRLDCRKFLDLAAELGCIGVELRNDLADKKLSSAEFFDGESPENHRRTMPARRVCGFWGFRRLMALTPGPMRCGRRSSC